MLDTCLFFKVKEIGLVGREGRNLFWWNRGKTLLLLFLLKKKEANEKKREKYYLLPKLHVFSIFRCAKNGYTSRWYHLSCGEHFCNECFDHYYRRSVLSLSEVSVVEGIRWLRLSPQAFWIIPLLHPCLHWLQLARLLCCSWHVCMLTCVHIHGLELSALMRQLFSLVCKIGKL